MIQTGEAMDLDQAVRALRQAWWLVALCAIVGGAIGLGVSSLMPDRYTSATQLFVSTTASGSATDVLQGSQFSQQRVTSYAQLITGQELELRVAERLQLNGDSDGLLKGVTASPVPNTVLLDITVSDESPTRAQSIARAIGEEFPQFVEELETTDETQVSPVRVTVTQRAGLPTAPSSPRPLKDSGIGAVAGLVVGAGLALLRARLDRSVKGTEEAGLLANAPVIGTVLRDGELERRQLVVRTAGGRAAEDYRQLRNNLQFLHVDNPPKVIMVSSAVPSEGKTTTVVNLALALADADRDVTIVEADLRRPKVSRYLGLVGGVGLTNLLAGAAEIDDVVQPYGEGRLRVIAAGPIPPNPGELLASSQMAELLAKLREAHDYVLIDAPPLLPVADSSGLAVHADGVLLSVRYGSTTRDQLQQAAATVERVGARTLGVILNIVPPKAEMAAAYGYGYSYEAESPRKGGKRRA